MKMDAFFYFIPSFLWSPITRFDVKYRCHSKLIACENTERMGAIYLDFSNTLFFITECLFNFFLQKKYNLILTNDVKHLTSN